MLGVGSSSQQKRRIWPVCVCACGGGGGGGGGEEREGTCTLILP